MWKQDIGQWVERKGHRSWVKQQPQVASTHSRPAVTRVGFIPEGFKDQNDDFTAMPEFRTAPRELPAQEEDPPQEGLQWVSVYGVSPNAILDVREYLDIMFGRTVDHTCPTEAEAAHSKSNTLTTRRGQNWFYVKFEDPVAAARAVYQSPLTIPIFGGHLTTASVRPNAVAAEKNGRIVREETVGVVWCTDEVFLRENREEEQNQQTRRGMGGGISEVGSPVRSIDGIQNALGVTPCGADRLRRTPVPPQLKDSSVARPSRGLGSLLREALHSPWSAQWTAVPSRGDASPPPSTAHGSPTSPASPAYTEVFRENIPTAESTTPTRNVEIPSCLISRGRYHHYSRVYHVNSIVPVRPIPGNLSVMCVFRADTLQRGLLRRIVSALARLPSSLSSLLFSSSLQDNDLSDGKKGSDDRATTASSASDSYWNSIFGVFSIDERYEQQQRTLRCRHYKAAARFPVLSDKCSTGETAVATVPIASWVPMRWYESSIIVSLLILLLLLLILLLTFFYGFGGSRVSPDDIWQAGRWDSDEGTPKPGVVTSTNAWNTEAEATPRVAPGRLEGTLVLGSIYSDKYTARTL